MQQNRDSLKYNFTFWVSTYLSSSQSCKFERLTMSEDIECEESFTPRDICPSIVQAHTGFVNSEPFMS